MKHLRKTGSLLLMLLLTLSLSMTAFAEGAGAGSIVIQNPAAGQTYKAYRILDLENFDKEKDPAAYAYKVNSDWKEFFAEGGFGKDYVEIDGNGYVQWTTDPAKGTNAALEAFAQAAYRYLEEHAKIAAAASATAPAPAGEEASPGSLTLLTADKKDQVPLGYYLVDSSMGTLCSLETTDGVACIVEKNGEPTVEKKVHEDSVTEEDADGYWADENDADIGQEVEYRTTITISQDAAVTPPAATSPAEPVPSEPAPSEGGKAGAQGYVLHDRMEGLDLLEVESVTLKGEGIDRPLTARVPAPGGVGEGSYDYEVLTGADDLEAEDPCDFHIAFTDSFCEGLKRGDVLVVRYKAVVRADAKIREAGTKEANPNETWLAYGDGMETLRDRVETGLYGLEVFKHVADGETPMANAVFRLKYENEKGEKQPFSLVRLEGKGEEVPTYRVCALKDCGETHTHVQSVTTDANGRFKIVGLDSGTYYLEESKAPAGYNRIPGDVKVVIERDGTVRYYNHASGVAEKASEDEKYPGPALTGTINVANHKGVLLPKTGGVGTAAFQVPGAALAALAAALLLGRGRRR